IAVRKNCLRTIARVDDFAKSTRDCVERFVPADSFEAALALGADSTHRIKDSIGVVDALEVACDFGAKKALRRRMIGISGDAGCASVFYLYQHRAGVGTIVWARTMNDLHFSHILDLEFVRI